MAACITLGYQSISQVVMADVPPESSVLNEEPCIKPEPPQESKLLEDPTAERSKDEGGEGEESSSSDVYRYIKEDLFTSEIFKVEIQNLPSTSVSTT
ncbi:hypothetical protein HF521_014400 [Silurus meridionalis]|uniref:Uncharacterized protein n=1 Tax=Silurus meridionalis TaxID=175797 RepID=A0A8T0A819_SILME|nr:hypothetical protein HF521_014400 [Silurus meridionalis]